MNKNEDGSNEGSANEGQGGQDSEAVRNSYHELDVINTQIQGQWEEGNASAEQDSLTLITEVDEFLALADGELYTKEEYHRLLAKLDTAIAIYNEPYARELRARLIERYGEK